MFTKIPTELKDEEIAEFQRIYKKDFGTDLSREEAIERGLSLICFIASVINALEK